MISTGFPPELEIEVDPERCGGVPVFTNSRLPFYIVENLISLDVPDDEILEGYPRLSPELLARVRAYLSR